VRDCGVWPTGHWRDGGQGTFGVKKYLEDVKKGIVPMTFWADDDYDEPLVLGSTSWEHAQSGHSQSGINELTSIVGPGHGFETVKPLKLFKKIIQIWCRPDGIVLDPFAGSGTTGHAVLELNHQTEANRRFLLIEQGRPERGDSYARTLTVDRLKRVLTGERVDKRGNVAPAADPLPGGFRFSKLTARVDGSAVLSLQREEMLDLLVTSHWDQSERAGTHLRRLPATAEGHLFARNSRNEGYFLVWSGPNQPSVLNRSVFRAIAEEARAEGLCAPFHVYARTSVYPGPNIQFYQIPDRILEKLGFSEATQPYSVREDTVA
jgi:adenine-specific DNA-methyltransferase